MPLIIDKVSGTPRLSGEELRRWCEEHSAFISSEMAELGDERRALAGALREIGLNVILFEDLGGREEDSETAYLDGVARSDIYIGVIADRYGRMLPSGRSPTHEEYLAAREGGKRMSIWVAEEGSARQGNARDFVQELQTFHTTGSFKDGEDLARRVVERIAEIAADQEAPWIKIGECLLRAAVIRDSGETIEIEADVRDPDVVHYLQQLRPDQWGRGSVVQLTTAEASGKAIVKRIVSESRSTSRQQFTIEAEIDWADGSANSMAPGTSGYSADDLAEIGLRHGLFGEPLPERLDSMSFLVPTADPLAAFDGLRVPEAAMAPIARLLVAEQLLSTGVASRVDQFLIGPAVQGGRQIALIYTEAKRYSNVEPEQRRIEGRRPAGR